MINIKDKLRRSNVLFSRQKIENVNYADRDILTEDENNLNAQINDINNTINNSVTNNEYNATISQLNDRINDVTEQVNNSSEIVEPVADVSIGINLSGSTFKSIPQEFVFSNAENLDNMFDLCSELESAIIDMSSAKSAKYMFNDNNFLTDIIITNWDNLEYAEKMFHGLDRIENISLPMNTKIIDATYMFAQSHFREIPLFNTDNLKIAKNMFSSCSYLQNIPHYNFSNCEDVSFMFYSCNVLKSVPLLNFSKVTTTYWTFNGCTSLTDLGGFKNLKVKLELHKSSKLTYQSIMNVINNLYDFRGNGNTSTTQTLKLHSNGYALLTEDDIKVANNKGWIISY